MNKPPAFQFYADDFLGGTILMSDAEVGKYIRALCIQWNKGGLTSDEMARLGLTVVEPGLNGGCDSVATKFKQAEDGLWKNHRLEAEREKQNNYRKLQSDKGKASAEARLNRGSTAVEPWHQPEVNSPSPSTSPSDNNKGRASLEDVTEFVVSKGLTTDDAQWFFYKMEGSGWRNNGDAVKSWRGTVSSWRIIGIFPSQKGQAPIKGHHQQQLPRHKDNPAKDLN